ncbi:MAG: glycoside hydrolase family 55 protein, partial [Clostridiales bacterium]|nr:glycoside hydrolase family 55 protein [Clostridiales bacterium]
MSWDGDGKSYDVYRASTRYGEYTLAQSEVTSGEYVDNSRFCYYKVCETDGAGEIIEEYAVSEEYSLFGDNVYVFSAADNADKVSAQIKTVYDGRLSETRSGEFSEGRSAFLLKPGTYNNKIELNVGYYMTYAGLGESPEAVTVNKLYSGNRTDAICDNALCNFWRGAENFTVKSGGTAMWATSQSSSLRAVKVNGNLQLSEGGKGTSGGFLADSHITGSVQSGSQQQWLTRNSTMNKWEGNTWNTCFAGVDGAPSGTYPANRYTVEDATSMREKPFLTFDETHGYRIAIPAVRENASGYSWSEENLDSRIEKYIEQSDIYFAQADRDSAKTINNAYKTHSAVVLTPGVYYLDEAIEINSNSKVLFGMGLATLMPLNGNSCLVTTGSDISVSGILVDTGWDKSNTLASIGKQGNKGSDVRLYDFYFRVGGFLEMDTAADCCLK